MLGQPRHWEGLLLQPRRLAELRLLTQTPSSVLHQSYPLFRSLRLASFSLLEPPDPHPAQPQLCYGCKRKGFKLCFFQKEVDESRRGRGEMSCSAVNSCWG